MSAAWSLARGVLLRPRGIVGGLLAVVALTLPGAAVFSVVARSTVEAGGTVGAAETTAFVLVKGSFAGLVGALMCALAVGGEYRHRTLVRSLLYEPRRLRYVMGQLVAAAALAVPYALVAAAASLLTVHVVVGSAAGDGPGAATVAGLVATAAAVAVIWAWVGVGVAHLCRSQAQPVAALVAGWLVVEPMARGLLSQSGGAARYVAALSPMVGAETLGRFAAGESSALFAPSAAPPQLAVVSFLVFAASVIALGAWRVQRRDPL